MAGLYGVVVQYAAETGMGVEFAFVGKGWRPMS
jgi:hypothetical protein